MNTILSNQSYKITHLEIKKLTTIRLKNHLDAVKQIKRDFTTGENNTLVSATEANENTKQQYINIKRYVYFINLELQARTDYDQVIKDISDKKETSKKQSQSKGCHHLKKQNK